MKKQPKNNPTTPATLAPVQVNNAEIITAENVQSLGERFAVKALKTYYQKSGMPFVYSLYCGLIADITENLKTGAPLSDGYDVAQTASALLCEYIGKRLDDISADGQTDKNGNPITIKTAVFRAISKYVNGERQREYKRAYVDETDENGQTIFHEIPNFWDMPTAHDYNRIREIIAKLDLPQRQLQVLRYRLQGIATGADSEKQRDSLRTIAQKMGISRQAVQNLLGKIRAKANAIGLTPNGITANV